MVSVEPALSLLCKLSLPVSPVESVEAFTDVEPAIGWQRKSVLKLAAIGQLHAGKGQQAQRLNFFAQRCEMQRFGLRCA